MAETTPRIRLLCAATAEDGTPLEAGMIGHILAEGTPLVRARFALSARPHVEALLHPDEFIPEPPITQVCHIHVSVETSTNTLTLVEQTCEVISDDDVFLRFKLRRGKKTDTAACSLRYTFGRASVSFEPNGVVLSGGVTGRAEERDELLLQLDAALKTALRNRITALDKTLAGLCCQKGPDGLALTMTSAGNAAKAEPQAVTPASGSLVITASGAAKAGGLLPAYPVKLRVLAEQETVMPGTLMLFGTDETLLENWTGVAAGSELCGGTVKAARMRAGDQKLVFARKVEAA